MENNNVVEGKLFLYEQPEMLAREDHSELGFTPTDTPYANTRDARAIPITMTEFRTAQKHYPIAFTGVEQPYPIAVTGIIEDRNLFLDNNDQWDELCYIPAYLRCYPFAFAQHGEDQMAVVIDRAAAVISENPEYPFFNDEEISEQTQQMTDFAATYVQQRKQTEEFCKMLAEKELLTNQHITYRPEGSEEDQILANYAAVDAKKLEELDSKDVEELHKNGGLASIHAHLFSLENWNHLVTRRRQRLA